MLVFLLCSLLGCSASLSPKEKSFRHRVADVTLEVVEYIQRAKGETTPIKLLAKCNNGP